ncbi:hypothetical protein ACHAWF_004706, partial [Thalassiosira exigua]
LLPLAKAARRRPSIAIARLLSSATSASAKFQRRSVRILYGSQTGTAELFARQLAESLDDEESVSSVSVRGLDEAASPGEVLAPGELNLLLTSCAGKGEPPDNARRFHEWITAAATDDPSSAKLSDEVEFAVFGLGNQAAHPNNYNVVGKEFDARLEELGARRVKALGLGDDGGCLEDDFDRWSAEVAEMIAADSSSPSEAVESSSDGDGEVVEQSERKSEAAAAEPEAATIALLASTKRRAVALDPPKNRVVRRDLFHLTGSNRFYADGTAKLKVIDNHLLTSDGGDTSLHEIRVSLGVDYADEEREAPSYRTGDHLLVYPRNSEAIVAAYVELLGVDPHAIVSDDHDDVDEGSYPHPTGITVAETLSHCVDLGALPSPGVCRAILGRKQLDYLHEIANPRRTILDLCRQSGTKLSLEDFLHSAAPMKPRYYSIASSNLSHPDEVHLVFRPVHYVTGLGYLREGVCTSFLAHKGAQTKDHGAACLPALISPNPGFRLPGDPRIPVLFIGAGCGVAPLRGFIEERMARAKRDDVGPATLFVGFRTPQDEVYRDLTRKALEAGALTGTEVAYASGCDRPGQCEMNVADLLRREGKFVWDHFGAGGHAYVCGGARTFGAATEAVLLDVFQEYGNMDFDAALQHLRDLVEEGRLAEDLAN